MSLVNSELKKLNLLSRLTENHGPMDKWPNQEGNVGIQKWTSSRTSTTVNDNSYQCNIQSWLNRNH